MSIIIFFKKLIYKKQISNLTGISFCELLPGLNIVAFHYKDTDNVPITANYDHRHFFFLSTGFLMRHGISFSV